MPITQLNHVNLRTTQLNAMVAWYTEVLGLVDGYRPHFPSHGAWLYVGDTPAVHLVEIEGEPAVGAEHELKLEHFAFSATDADAFESRLDASGTRFERVRVESAKIMLYNVWDPDGNHIHVDFAAAEAEGVDLD